MLPLKNRLKKKKEFESAFKAGKIYSGDFFILKTKENKSSFSRFAFVCPVKNEKKAVLRNKNKRLFRAIIKERISSFKENIDGIFIIKKEVKGKTYQEIKKDVEKVLKEHKLI